jgi:hypothetical protein
VAIPKVGGLHYRYVRRAALLRRGAPPDRPWRTPSRLAVPPSPCSLHVLGLGSGPAPGWRHFNAFPTVSRRRRLKDPG